MRDQTAIADAGPTQLTLALRHSERLSREDFLEGPGNAEALALIERWPDWPARVMLLTGPEGSGKSHLAAIWAQAAGARTVSARSLDRDQLPSSLVTGALVVESLAAGRFDEAALFHLLNLAREEEAFLLLTAREVPVSWRVGLPDLSSRLRAVPAVSLEAPDDTLLRAVIVKLFSDRQLTVDENLVRYVASRIERSFAAARAAVAILDREALRLGRPVTRALAGELFTKSLL